MNQETLTQLARILDYPLFYSFEYDCIYGGWCVKFMQRHVGGYGLVSTRTALTQTDAIQAGIEWIESKSFTLAWAQQQALECREIDRYKAKTREREKQ